MHMHCDIVLRSKLDVPGFLGRLLFMQAVAIPVIVARVGILVALAFLYFFRALPLFEILLFQMHRWFEF